ncbi:hypothetical protein GF351_00780 [Candidatus Woesearchaeota archaeon]|nr:hypothetical protein [Candidatus Woesearchaeota archaeon]
MLQYVKEAHYKVRGPGARVHQYRSVLEQAYHRLRKDIQADTRSGQDAEKRVSEEDVQTLADLLPFAGMNDHRTRLIADFYRDEIPEKYEGTIAASRAAKEAEREEREARDNLPDPSFKRRWAPDPGPQSYRRTSGPSLYRLM